MAIDWDGDHTSDKWTKGKLKTLDEVKENAGDVLEGDVDSKIYHSKSRNCIGVRCADNFGEVVDIKLWETRSYGLIYEDSDRRLYYDEWFEWIGEEPPIMEPLPESLWDISDW